MATRVDFHGRLDSKKRTPQGGLRIDANLTRTGVFLYRDARGATVREYRPPEEVFKADSLETLKLATLTVGHPDMVRTDNFRDLSVGIVAENVRPRDQYVAADVLVQDQDTIDRVEREDLVELSCGYEVDLDLTPGTTPEGERYDAVHRNIRYNHVGLGGPGWGRAGSNVRLHLDGGEGSDTPVDLDEAGNVRLDSYSPVMTAEEKARLDRAEAERDAFRLDADNAKKALDAEKAERAKLEADQRNKHDAGQISALVAARVSLEGSARAVLGTDFKSVKSDGAPKSDSEIVAEVLAKADPSLKIDGREPGYLRARFDVACEAATKALEAHGALNAATGAPEVKADGSKIDAVTTPKKDALDEAFEIAEERRKASAKAGPPAGAVTRK